MIYNLPVEKNFYEAITEYVRKRNRKGLEINKDYYNILIIVPNNHIAYCLKRAFDITCVLPQIYTLDNIFERYALLNSKRLSYMNYINFQDKAILEIYELLAKEKQFFSIETAKQFFYALMNTKEIEHEYFPFIKQEFGSMEEGKQSKNIDSPCNTDYIDDIDNIENIESTAYIKQNKEIRASNVINKIGSYIDFQKEAIAELFLPVLKSKKDNIKDDIEDNVEGRNPAIIVAAFNLNEGLIINSLFEKCLEYKQTIFICGFNSHNFNKPREGEHLREKLETHYLFHDLNSYLTKVAKEQRAITEDTRQYSNSSDSKNSYSYNSVGSILFFKQVAYANSTEAIIGKEKIKIIKCPNDYYLLAATEECLKANYKDVALIGNDPLLLGKLAHRLLAYNITLCYKKPLKEHLDFLFLANLLELIIQPNRNKNLLNFLKHPYIYEDGSNFWEVPRHVTGKSSNIEIELTNNNKDIINEIEYSAIRKLRFSKGWQGLKGLLLKEAKDFLTSLEILLAPLWRHLEYDKEQKNNKDNSSNIVKYSYDHNYNLAFEILKCAESLTKKPLYELRKILNFLLRNSKLAHNDLVEYRSILNFYVNKAYFEEEAKFENKIKVYAPEEALLLVEKNIVFLNAQEKDFGINNKITNYNLYHLLSGQKNIYIFYSQQDAVARIFLKLENFIIRAIDYNFNNSDSNISFTDNFSSLEGPSQEILKIEPAFLPNILTATMLEYLLNDPYKFYLKYILKLKEPDPIDKKPSYKEFGILLHEALQEHGDSDFLNKEITHESLMKSFGLQAKKYYPNFAYVKTLWLAKFSRMAENFIAWHNSRKDNIQTLETGAEYELPIQGFNIKVKLDRIEYLKDGSASIIDFKTGVLPTFKDIENFVKPQLLLQSLAFKKIKNINISELTYFKPEIERILEKGIEPKSIASLTTALENKLSSLLEDYQSGKINFAKEARDF